jgi:hypothetical protein
MEYKEFIYIEMIYPVQSWFLKAMQEFIDALMGMELDVPLVLASILLILLMELVTMLAMLLIM